MSLLLIRHGETPLNVARVLQPADTPLSDQGQAQAAALARRLVGAGLAGIVSSDLPRARQTADHLARVTGLAVVITPLLQERNFGDLRGLPYDQLEIDPIAMEAAPPGGESTAQFEGRVAEAFAHVLRLQAALGGPLAVVSHGLVVKAMLRIHAALGADQVLPPGMHNTSMSIVSATPPHAVELLNCTTHLREGLTEAVGKTAGSLSGG